MTKEQFQAILKSLISIFTVAYILAFAVNSISGHYSFFPWQWFSLFVILQIVGLPLYDMLTERLTIARAITEATREQTTVLEQAVSKQSLNLNCAYCSQPNREVPIILTQENSFKCIHCGQENAVYMQFYAARKTNPVVTKVEKTQLEEGVPGATPTP